LGFVEGFQADIGQTQVLSCVDAAFCIPFWRRRFRLLGEVFRRASPETLRMSLCDQAWAGLDKVGARRNWKTTGPVHLVQSRSFTGGRAGLLQGTIRSPFRTKPATARLNGIPGCRVVLRSRFERRFWSFSSHARMDIQLARGVHEIHAVEGAFVAPAGDPPADRGLLLSLSSTEPLRRSGALAVGPESPSPPAIRPLRLHQSVAQNTPDAIPCHSFLYSLASVRWSISCVSLERFRPWKFGRPPPLHRPSCPRGGDALGEAHRRIRGLQVPR